MSKRTGTMILSIGTLDDFDEMIKAFKNAEIHVINDLVPNHMADTHTQGDKTRLSPVLGILGV